MTLSIYISGQSGQPVWQHGAVSQNGMNARGAASRRSNTHNGVRFLTMVRFTQAMLPDLVSYPDI